MKVERVKQLFEWGWGAFTYENAKNMVDSCLNQGYQQKYPEQGMLAWDLVRVLSIVGGAYMGGIMEYEEAAKIALNTCKILQDNFSSWDDMAGSYTLGYQFWRGKKKKDRLKYYQYCLLVQHTKQIGNNRPPHMVVNHSSGCLLESSLICYSYHIHFNASLLSPEIVRAFPV